MHRVERCGHGTNLERRGADDLDVGTLSSKSFTMEETHASLSHDTNDISDADRIRSISDSARGAVSSSNLAELTRPDPMPPPDESLNEESSSPIILLS